MQANNCPSTTRNAYEDFRRGCIASIPVVIGFIPIGLVMGTQAHHLGFLLWEIPLLTGCNFAGGSEFAALGVWSMPPSILLIVAITFLVNCRHILMGAALVPLTGHLPLRKILPALFFMCDESWALALGDALSRPLEQRSSSFSLSFYLGAALPMYLSWISSTAMGGVFGPILGNISSFGFDLAFPAVIIVIMRGMWKGLVPALPWIVSFAAALAAIAWLPGAWYVPCGAGAGLLTACIMGEAKCMHR